MFRSPRGPGFALGTLAFVGLCVAYPLVMLGIVVVSSLLCLAIGAGAGGGE